MASDEPIVVNLVLPWPNEQPLVALRVARGTDIRQALCAAGFESLALEVANGALGVGIYGERRPLDYTLQHGDRVEVCRPLQADPKDARKRRARC